LENFFIISWLLSGVSIVFGLVYLIIGITYKNWKKISISIISLALGIAFYFLPYFFILKDLKVLKLHS